MKKLARSLTMLVAFLCLLLPNTALAAGPVTTHDGSEIRALLEGDGDVAIQLDGDVDWSAGRMTDRPMAEIQYPCAHTDLIDSGLHPTSHKGSMQVWATMGSGSKTIDLAGHDLHVSVDDAGTRWAEADTQLYLVGIPAGAALTVDDSSGTNKGTIRFDGYLHAGASGAAGTQSANYYNRNVVYRNVFRVDGGALTYNGGSIATRSKQQYLSPGRSWDSLIGPAYTGNVRQQVNCTAITLLAGNVLVNGGIIEGRGYRFMYSGATSEGLWYSSEYWPAAAIYAEGGSITVNAGTFNGMGGANVFDVMSAKIAGSSIKVRSGYFHTHKVDRVLVPAADDNGGNSGTGAPRYMSQGYGTVGLHGDFIDGLISEVTVDGTTYTYDLSGAPLNTSADVTVAPAQSAQLDLYDTGTNAPVSNTDPLVWNGADSRKITFVPDFMFQGYPWTDGYYQGIFESGKTMGVSSKITIGGTVHSVGGATVDAAKEITLSAAEVRAMLDADGRVSFDLKDLLPDGLGAGDTFALRVRYSENLMPYNGEKCAGSLVHAANVSVVVKPDALQVTGQPEDVYYEGSESTPTTTLTATAKGATKAWWVKVWPTKDEYKDIQAGASFDPSTGTAKLDGIPYGTSASYYRCYFSNDYSTAVSDVACVRMKLADNIESAGASVALHTNLASGLLAVAGDLLSAFNSTMPDSGIRAVTWYKGDNAVTLDDRVHIVPSTPHLGIKNPQAGDAGTYYADVTVDFNGKPATFRTGKYNVTVDTMAPASIDKIELHSAGALYLGDEVPEPTTFFSSYDERYSIESATWNGAYVGQSFAVPTAYCSYNVSAAEGYSFGPSGQVPVYMDGQLIGTSANMESGPPYTYKKVNATYKPKELLGAVSRNALDEFIGLEQGSANIEKQLNPTALYNATGQVAQDAGVTSNSYNAAEILSGLSLNQSGLLTGTLAQDAALGAHSGLVKFRTSRAGSTTNELQSGITIAVLRHITPLALGTLAENTHAHTWGPWTDNGDNTHSRTCTVCGAAEVGGHNWDEGVITTEPTPSAASIVTFTCEDCGATKTSPAPYESHSQLVHVEEVAPTCESAGTKAHYLCEECLLKFSDKDALSQVADDDLVLPATGHDWGMWKVVQEPTADVAGIERRVCRNDPSHVETRAIDPSVAVFTITYNLNGGTLDGKTGTVEVRVTAGQTITLPKPERDGYEFDYWEGSRYDAGDSYTVTDDHVFTAQWKRPAAAGAPSGAAAGTAAAGTSPTRDKGGAGRLANTGDALCSAAPVAVLCIVALAVLGAVLAVKR